MWYSLKDVGSAVDVDVDTLINELKDQGTERLSEKVAEKCIAAICESVDPNAVVVMDSEIAGVRELPYWCVKSIQRPDVIVYTDNTKKKVAVTVEIRSSPMLWTERKAIFGVTTMLRLLRCSDIEVNSFVTFAFPNLENQCIIRIEVKWVGFTFETMIKRFEHVTSALAEFRAVIAEQAKSLPALPTTIPRFAIKLSKRECNEICQSPGTVYEQLASSNHVMVKSGSFIFKLIYSPLECQNYLRYIHMLPPKPVHLLLCLK